MYVSIESEHPYGTDANLPISVALLKARMRISVATEDALIKEYIKSATMIIEKYIRRTIVETNHILTIDQVRGELNTVNTFLGSRAVIYLGNPPVLDVDSLIFYTDDGTASEVSSADFYVDKKQGRILPIGGYTWQSSQRTINAVQVSYTSGLVELGDVESIDPSLVTAIAQFATQLYESRGGECELPKGTKQILNQFKLVRVGKPFMGISFNETVIRSGSIGGY